ncbi:fatty alcohol:caffeoyl-CoA acyltransferase-like [Salvia hispanica]|uniref:fatty alcohol:caffeoyl-CoA acyltransferase-like n=1 Tax=Salvia hispanica TaxID=49212 RepID=UPI00200986C4|nr:fatty alcohol:caffeoyl-CoA acyltransferase-like [Salvia hispanica]
MAGLSPIPAFDDLKITFQKSSLIFPSQETQKRSFFLSNIDQIGDYNAPTAHFFKRNPDLEAENVAKMLKIALEKVLVHYDFMAGRLKLNNKTGRLEIDCNAAGAGFVVASSELLLEEIGPSLVHPNLGYRQLADHNLPSEIDQPLCVFQVTSFKCGGFAIGMSTNHILLDGVAAKIFLQNLSSQAFGDGRPLPFPPCNNRRLLAARSPPNVTFPHLEFIDLHLPTGEGSRPPNFNCSREEELRYRIFKMNADDIAKLKKKAKDTTVSSFSVAAAVIWRCKAFSGDAKPEKNDTSTLLTVIDVRHRVKPPLPQSYSGNAILPIRVSATFKEVESGPFSNVAGKISQGMKGISDEYVRSVFDWLEAHRGLPHGDYMVSSWLGLGFEQVEYPWGKPLYSCPIVHHRKDICWVFRDGIDGGIAAMVALPAEEMIRFEGLFHDFL